MAFASIPTGTVVSHYRFLMRVGAGGMGEVYAGEDITLRRPVALKAIRAERRLDPDLKARFLREARILSQLDHPHICRVYDYVEAPECDWLVLELLEGATLTTALRQGLTPAGRLRIARQIADVLVTTHAAGVVHRDLKPANVMCLASGNVKVLDFGLAAPVPPAAGPVARSVRFPERFSEAGAVANLDTELPPVPTASDARPDSAFRSTAGHVTGTAAYMSPEQAKGEPATTASDIYSFGLLLQEIVSGAPPYEPGAQYSEQVERAKRGESQPADDLPGDLRALVERCKSLAPAARPTAVEVVARLAWIQEAPRRYWRNGAVAAALVAAVVGSAKYTVDLSRERTLAVEARSEADRRRDQAEGLIGFMLGDLRGKLQQAGRLDLLDDVGTQAVTYFGAVPAAALSTEELFRRGQALHQIGELRQARADLPGAKDAYRESLDVAREAAGRDPANTEWQLGLATSHFYLGEVLRRQADLDGALEHFTAYRDIAQRLTESSPDNDTFQLELSYAHSGIAAVQEARGQFAEARSALERAQALRATLAERQPDDVERQQALATGHNRLGVVLARLGEHAAALEHFEADLAIRQRLVARAPADRSLLRPLQVAHSWVATGLEDRGDLEAALAHVTEQLAISSAQAARDPANVDWARDLGRAEFRVGVLQRYRGDLAASTAGLQRAVAILRPIAEKAAGDLARRRDLADAALALASTRLARGEDSAALAQAEEVERLVSALPALASTADGTRLRAEAQLVAGEAQQRAGHAGPARTARAQALALLAPIGPSSTDARVRTSWAHALRAAGRTEEAAVVAAALEAAGYRHPALVAVSRVDARSGPERGSSDSGALSRR